MTNGIGVADQIGKLAGGLLSGGGVTSVASAVAEALKLINKLTEDNPQKRVKAQREYLLSLIAIIKEIEGASTKDVSDLLDLFRTLMDGK